jgi:hypothetical protein
MDPSLPFLPKTALEMARQNEMPSHPFLTGITSQEGAYVLATFYGNPLTMPLLLVRQLGVVQGRLDSTL